MTRLVDSGEIGGRVIDLDALPDAEHVGFPVLIWTLFANEESRNFSTLHKWDCDKVQAMMTRSGFAKPCSCGADTNFLGDGI